MLFICQQYITAQNYNLGKQKQSFAYKTLYANRAQKTPLVKNTNVTINTQHIEPIATETIAVETMDTQSIQQIASTDDIQKCEQEHKQIVKLASQFSANRVFYKYDNLYKKLPKTTENIQNLLKIQIVVSSYFNTNGSLYPYIGSQLKNASSMEEEIQIFLSYYKE